MIIIMVKKGLHFLLLFYPTYLRIGVNMSNINHAIWDGTQVVIVLSSGQKNKCKSSNFTLGSHEVVSCNVNGSEVHVLTKTKGTSKVSRCHIVSMHGQYKGSKNI